MASNYFWCHKVVFDGNNSVVFLHIDTSLLDFKSHNYIKKEIIECYETILDANKDCKYKFVIGHHQD